MAKLTKAEAKAHAEAEAILAKDSLTDDDRLFVMEHWQEAANHVNSAAGAFFTPFSLARDTAIDVYNTGRIIDLCAGMGTLSLAVFWNDYYNRRDSGQILEMVCVELNPAYVEVGRKMLPEARWICGSIFDLPDDLGHFDNAVSNPPFGRIKRDGDAPRYTGAEFEYHVIDIASDLADRGTFIIPQMSAGFRLSGAQYYEHSDNERDTFRSEKYQKFAKQTGIRLDCGAGVDTTFHQEGWHGVSPLVEIACADFTELDRKPATVTVLEQSDALDFGDWQAAS